MRPRFLGPLVSCLLLASACGHPGASSGVRAGGSGSSPATSSPDGGVRSGGGVPSLGDGTCHPCRADVDCGGGGSCVALGKASGVDGRVCAWPCGAAGHCPESLTCLERTGLSGSTASYCVPQAASCPCSSQDVADQSGTPCLVLTYDGDDNLVGKCEGLRTCTAQGLGACVATSAPPEVCDGADNDCNGLVDDVGSGCDDANTCTADSCDPAKGCTHAAIPGGCDVDGKSCTSDTCQGGVCLGGSVVGCPVDATPTWSPGPCTLPPVATCPAASEGKACGVTFARTFGSPFEEEGRGVLARPDGGVVLLGGTDGWSASGKRDAFLVRTDGCGNPGIVRGYGGKEDDDLGAIADTSDGGMILGGTSRSFSEWFDGWLVRTDAMGSVQWSMRFGGPGFDEVRAVRQVADGSFVAMADTFSGAPGSPDKAALLVAGIGVDGTLGWTRIFGGAAGDVGADLVEARDASCGPGGTLIAGTTATWGAGLHDVWTVRLDAGGNVLWSKAYGSPAEESAHAAARMPDGGFAIVGQTTGQLASGTDGFVLRLDAAGTVLWMTRLGGSDDDLAHSVQAVPGGLLVAGHGEGLGAGSQDAFVARLADDGMLVWAHPAGTLQQERDIHLAAMPDGGMVLAGRTLGAGNGHFDTWLVKLDSLGTAPGQKPTVGAQWTTAAVQVTAQDVALQPLPSGIVTGATVPAQGFPPPLNAGWAQVQAGCK